MDLRSYGCVDCRIVVLRIQRLNINIRIKNRVRMRIRLRIRIKMRNQG
jgi:hypothetical protein